jgi:hypothetical protein
VLLFLLSASDKVNVWTCVLLAPVRRNIKIFVIRRLSRPRRVRAIQQVISEIGIGRAAPLIPDRISRQERSRAGQVRCTRLRVPGGGLKTCRSSKQALPGNDGRDIARCRRGQHSCYATEQAVRGGVARLRGQHFRYAAEQAVRSGVRRFRRQHFWDAAEQAFGAVSDGMLVGAGAVHGNCRSKFGKSGGGVTQGDAGMFWRESGLDEGKNGGCQAIAPARLAGMSAQ